MSNFAHLTYFSPKFHDEIFLKTDIICVNHLETGCLKKKSLTTELVFVLFEVLLCMVVRFWYFPRHNVVARTCVAFQYATDERITINAFYGRNSHFLCFCENMSQSLMEKKRKIRTK